MGDLQPGIFPPREKTRGEELELQNCPSYGAYDVNTHKLDK